MEKKSEIKKTEYEDYLNKIEYYAFQKKLKKEIKELLFLNDVDLKKIIESINIPDIPEKYNRYQKLMNQMKKNADEKKSESAKKSCYHNFDFWEPKIKIAQKVANQEITIPEASAELKWSLLWTCVFLSRIQNKQLLEQLRPFLLQFGFGIIKEKKKDLNSFSEQFLKEIMLMSLTYRVSFKVLAEILDTTIEELITFFAKFEDLFSSMSYLFEETLNEDEQNEKLAKYRARQYLKTRNKLLIYDTILFETIHKNISNLSQEERDLIAWYPIKYNYSLEICEKTLKRNRQTISLLQEELAMRNMIFAEKLDFYKKNRQQIGSKYIYENTKFSRGGGSK